jgi:hypothetical protein
LGHMLYIEAPRFDANFRIVNRHNVDKVTETSTFSTQVMFWPRVKAQRSH